MIHDEPAPWPVIHLADAAKDEAVCGRRPPDALLTILYERTTCIDCLLIDNENRARVFPLREPGVIPRKTPFPTYQVKTAVSLGHSI